MTENPTIYIYTLSDPRTEEVRYVGVTKDMRKRFNLHMCMSRNPRYYVSRWIRTLTAENLKPTHTLIEETDIEHWADRERHWIAFYRAAGCHLTNLCEGGEGVLFPSPETLQRRSVSLKNYSQTIPKEILSARSRAMHQAKILKDPDWFQKFNIQTAEQQREYGHRAMEARIQKYGCIWTEEMKHKLGQTVKQVLSIRTPEQNADRGRKAWNTRRLRGSQIPTGVNWTPELRAKQSESAKNRLQDPDQKQKLMDMLAATHSTPEYKAKMSAVAKARAAAKTPEERRAHSLKAAATRKARKAALQSSLSPISE